MGLPIPAPTVEEMADLCGQGLDAANEHSLGAHVEHVAAGVAVGAEAPDAALPIDEELLVRVVDGEQNDDRS